jgi:hypothetical protein
MSPTWRRGTTLVGHPAVLHGIGSPGRCEAAMEYIERLSLGSALGREDHR